MLHKMKIWSRFNDQGTRFWHFRCGECGENGPKTGFFWRGCYSEWETTLEDAIWHVEVYH